jgi:sterol desaturase/sphingolipid hydroxylase (fatty acid hydroxylase superfamily)
LARKIRHFRFHDIFALKSGVMQHAPKNEGTTALFKNPILEKLARTHISVPLTIYFVGSAVLLYLNFARGYTSVSEGIGVFLLGLVFWTWFEYIMHKHIFHMLPTNKLKERIQYTFHGVHHEYPRDKTRLAMPPVAAVAILTVLFFSMKLILGNYVYTFLPGFVIGYSLYLFVHYAVHAFRPPKNNLNVLWINHSIHHYKDDTVAFGVSSPLWDVIYGTMPKKTYKRKKPVKKHAAAA